MMDNKLTEDFLARVNQIIKSEDDKDQLFLSLRNYRNSLDLDSLMKGLRSLVSTPDRLGLYDTVRPLIPLHHQLAYDRRTLWASSQRRLRVVRLPRRDLAPHAKLGLAVRGGLEYGVGFFVSQVLPESLAARAGLREGDQIVRINGFLAEHATHAEVTALMRSRAELLLKVRRVGMLPRKEQFHDSVSWVASSCPADSDWDGQSHGSEDDLPADVDAAEMRLFLNTRGAQTLGCTIFSGPGSQPGIFIQSVVPGGLTAEAGLAEGDQIVSVNGVSFLHISHSAAILTLKGSSSLMLTVRRGAGLELLRSDALSIGVDSTDALERRKVEQLRELTTRRDSSDVKMTVNRLEAEDGRTSTRTVDSSSDTLTPSVDERVQSLSSNSNVFFRRPEERDSGPSLSSPPQPRHSRLDDTIEAPLPSLSVLANLHFSEREAGGRAVESVRLTPKPAAFDGSGLELEEMPGGRVVVAGVDYGSPAFQADVRKGDYLLAIGVEKVNGQRLEDVLQLLRAHESQPEYILSLGRAPAGLFDDEITYF